MRLSVCQEAVRLNVQASSEAEGSTELISGADSWVSDSLPVVILKA